LTSNRNAHRRKPPQDASLADVGINGDKVTAPAPPSLPRKRHAHPRRNRHARYSRRHDVQTHLDMPFFSFFFFRRNHQRRRFKPDHRRRCGGPTTLIGLRHQYTRHKPSARPSTLTEERHGQSPSPISFHCIITDLGSAQLEENGQAHPTNRRTRFKLFLAYPGSLCSMTGRSKAMRQAAKSAASSVCTRKNGGANRRIVQQALAEGKTRAEDHALTRPTNRRSRSHFARPLRSRKWPEPSVYRPHLSCNEALEKVAKRATADSPISRDLPQICISR